MSSASAAAIRGSVMQKLDFRFFGLVILSVLIHTGIIVYLNSIPIQKDRVMKLEEIPERFAKLIIDKPIKKPKAQDKTKGDQAAKEAKEDKEPATPEEKAQKAKVEKREKVVKAQKSVAARAKKVEKKLRSAGVLGVLSGVGGTARGPAVVDVLGSRGRFSGAGDLDEAISGISGLTKNAGIADQKLVRSKDASGTAARGEISDLLSSLGTAKSGALSKRGTIQYKKPDIVGDASNSAKRDHKAISRVVKQNLTSIKMSYEKYLKRQPDLSGKITVRFTIEEDGSVSQVEIVEVTMECPALEKEIVRKIKRWRFAPLSGESGSTAVTYPFVFQPT